MPERDEAAGTIEIAQYSWQLKEIKLPKLKQMGYSSKYDTSFNDETGEWEEKIGFCPEENACEYCKAYNEDGRPAIAFDAPEDAIDKEE